MGVEWVDLAGNDLIVVGILVAVALGPYVSATRGETSLALATVLSLMLVAFVQFAYSVLYGVPMQFSWMIDLLGIKPSVMGDPTESYRMLSAAWLHADWIHVLSNILVIALIGIPLEQRLGGWRWFAVYFLGFLGGNLAWVLSHPDGSCRIPIRYLLPSVPAGRRSDCWGLTWHAGQKTKLSFPCCSSSAPGRSGSSSS